ncbi:MAG TPA: response regulator transcription factor, partial [Acidimicrobiia bacterium]
MIRVLVADDQAMVRSGLRLILEGEDDIVVVAEAANGEEAVRLARRERPDVILMDVRMPVMDGLESTGRITHELPEARVIVLTTFDLDDYVYGALR